MPEHNGHQARNRTNAWNQRRLAANLVREHPAAGEHKFGGLALQTQFCLLLERPLNQHRAVKQTNKTDIKHAQRPSQHQGEHNLGPDRAHQSVPSRPRLDLCPSVEGNDLAQDASGHATALGSLHRAVNQEKAAR